MRIGSGENHLPQILSPCHSCSLHFHCACNFASRSCGAETGVHAVLCVVQQAAESAVSGGGRHLCQHRRCRAFATNRCPETQVRSTAPCPATLCIAQPITQSLELDRICQIARRSRKKSCVIRYRRLLANPVIANCFIGQLGVVLSSSAHSCYFTVAFLI